MSVKGLTRTSELIQISGDVEEPAANTATFKRIDLQLNPLDNEVFVVQAVDLNVGFSDNRTDTQTFTSMTLSATERNVVGSLASPSTIAYSLNAVQNVGDTCAVFSESKGGETPPASLDYVFILATNDFYANIGGTGNALRKGGSFRVYGYRAKASAAIYAALVQSELTSQ